MAEIDLAPITTGTYQGPLDATLLVDESTLASWFGIDVTIPTREGATRASLTVNLYNGDNEIYASMTDAPFDDMTLGTPLSLHREFTPMQTNNEAYTSAPSTTMVEIASIYWCDDNWDIVDQVESGMQWAWSATGGGGGAQQQAQTESTRSKPTKKTT